jgi:hypothetical protein
MVVFIARRFGSKTEELNGVKKKKPLDGKVLITSTRPAETTKGPYKKSSNFMGHFLVYQQG